MKFLKSNIEIFENKSPAKFSKRIVSWMIDFLLLTLVTLGLYNLSYLILKNTNSYKEADTQVHDEISYYNDFIKDTHLVEFVSGEGEEERKDNETMTLELINKHIVRSYKIDPTQFSVEPTASMKFGEATLENDNLAYFFTQYVPSHNENNDILDFNGVEPVTYYKNFIEDIIKIDFSSFFLVEKDTNYLYLNPYVADKVYSFLVLNNKNHEKTYMKVYNTFSYAFEEAEKLILQSKTYNKEHYVPFLKAQSKQAQYVNISFILTSIVSYFIIICVPQILFRDGVTIGRFATGLGVINTTDQKVKWWQILIRNLLGTFGSLMVCCMIPILPIFNFNFNNFPLPLFDFGAFQISLGWTLIAIFIVSIIGNGIMFFTKGHKTLTDYASVTKVVDSKSID